MDSFGKLLQHHRRSAALSQEGLAERAGLSVRTIRDLETMRAEARPTSRVILSDALGLSDEDRLRFFTASNRPDPERAMAGPSFLPYDVADFTGREAECQRLLSAADSAGSNAVVISAIDGMAGVGKTTLAVHVAHQLAGRFPDGRFFVDLHGFTPGREPLASAEALDSLLRALGVAPDRIPDELDQRSGLWRAELAGRRALIVLDNAATVEQVRALLPGSPGCLALITSRRRLPNLAGASAVSLDVLSAEEAVELLGRIIGAERAAQDPVAAAEIADLCGLLPLAIRIAAARLMHRPHWTLAHLAARLRAGQEKLRELSADERSIGAAFHVSYLDLPEERRHFFRLLSLVPGRDFDSYAAAAVAGLALDTADGLLEGLLDDNLVQQHALGRYAFHDLIREHACEAATAEESAAECTSAASRLLDFYSSLTAAAALQLYPPVRDKGITPISYVADKPELSDQAAALLWMDAEHGNLMAAIAEATRRSMHLNVCHLAFWSGHYLLRRSHLDEYRQFQRLSIAASRELGDQAFAASAATGLALAHFQAARYRDALSALDEGEEAAESLGEPVALANHHGLTATVLLMLGHTRRAVHRFQQALRLLETVERPAMVALIQGNYSKAQMFLGNRDIAIELSSQALSTHRATGNRRGEGVQLYFLGEIHSYFGEIDQATSYLRESLVWLEEAGDVASTAMALVAYADVLRKQGRHDEAFTSAKRALDDATDSRMPATQAEAHNVLGAIYQCTADYDQALQHHQRALAIATDIEYPIEQARAAGCLATTYAAVGNRSASQQNQVLANEIYTQMGVQPANAVPAP